MSGIKNTTNETYNSIMGNGIKYEIPKFQRDYSWDTENWDELWDDISYLIDNTYQEHYMGYLVLLDKDDNNKIYNIIDGQQRLITMSLLILAALKNINELKDSDEENIKRVELFKNTYIGIIDPATLIPSNKLTLNRNNNDYYKKNLVDIDNDLPSKNLNASEKLMKNCFIYFYNRLKETYTTGVDLAEFIKNIVDKLYFTVIKVGNELNASIVFETLNARGVQLSSADLLKNYLFSVINSDDSTEKEIDEIDDKWQAINNSLGEHKFDDFLRYYWNSQNKTIGKKEVFKTIKNNINTKIQVFELLKELDNLVDSYVALFDYTNSIWNDDPEISENIKLLNYFKIKQATSLLLVAFNKLSTDEFKKLLKRIIIISFRYNIIGKYNPNDIEKTYNNVALSIYKNNSYDIELLRRIYISNEIFEIDFSNKEFTQSMKIPKYILIEIEKNMQGNMKFDIDDKSISVEHIIPKSSENSWENMNYHDIKRAKNRLGNLTLLTVNSNISVDTKSFNDKKTEYLKSNSTLTKDISNYDTWGITDVVDRQKSFAKIAKSIWQIQELN
ncbi:MAG: DUF262 domain-containing HNH endonuclease family protein [Bifidobacteriaceae bacterium]|jgi:uncharacterized protein with ParB-like and HNH nuclease domain|nr:DUF262 domain-containing HNH endonuclease family protein [Bifidobacteriaceae bacterium]